MNFLITLWTLVSNSLAALFVASIFYAIFWLDAHTLIVDAIIVLQLGFIATIKRLTANELSRPTKLIDQCPLALQGSFPCGHCAVVTFVLIYGLWCFWRYARENWSRWVLIYRMVLLSIYSSLIVIARLVLDCNSLLDVYGGVIIGSLCALILIRVFARSSLYFAKQWSKDE